MIEVLKQALEAFETEVSIDWTNNDEFNASAEKMHDAITSLRQAIAELESQEPVAVWELFEDGWDSIADPEWMESLPIGTKLYTHPPQRTEPVGVMVSMDVSKGDEPEYRIFGRIYEVMKDGESEDEVTYLAIEDSRNFDTPPQRTWVGLTDEETERLIHNFGSDPHTLLDEVDARLKARNT
jgi:hypothetical protein